ncbi:MAG TPA: hypothetical protein VML96_13415 [Egibacteraceae bacterium]|nr:hypothetical protein [Egibacteraceae bacterium]
MSPRPSASQGLLVVAGIVRRGHPPDEIADGREQVLDLAHLHVPLALELVDTRLGLGALPQERIEIGTNGEARRPRHRVAKAPDVVLPAHVADGEHLPLQQVAEIVWEHPRRRHERRFHQRRNHGDARPPERGADLVAHEVVGLEQARAIRRVEPARPDHREADGGTRERRVDRVAPLAGADTRDVPEDMLASKPIRSQS